MNALLVLAPSWVTGVAFPLAILGLAGWPGELGLRARLAVLVYLAAFAIVGQPFNDYWGWMYTPLLVFGFVAAPVALWDLLRAILRPASREENPKSKIQNPKQTQKSKPQTPKPGCLCF
jgi:hypothetical protein